MLLNTALSPTPPPGTPDASAETARATPAAAPPTGRALLPVLEQLAQHELATMIATQPPRPAPPEDPAFAGLAWDLGLTGAALEDARR